MGRQGAVVGRHRPVVGEHVGLVVAEREHRLDGEAQARLQLAAAATGPGAAGPQAAGQAGRGQGGRGFTPVQIGPSAPVPPEVAMLRPSAAELSEINSALKSFIDTNATSAKELLKKYESLLMVQPPRLNTAATFTQTAQRQGPRHLGFGIRLVQPRVVSPVDSGRSQNARQTNVVPSPGRDCRFSPNRGFDGLSPNGTCLVPTSFFPFALSPSKGVLPFSDSLGWEKARMRGMQ